jgi:FG-GAP repeat protein
VGAPSEDLGSTTDAGAVNLLYGGAGGLSTSGNQFWSQNSAGVADAAEGADLFGAALAPGDLNGDGRDDLAAGVPFEGLGSVDGAGAVNVLYGNAGGLSTTGNQFWSQNSTGIADTPEAGDNFGTSLGGSDGP